nr:SusE domain-containing protein [uncultured Lacibacter sp.]
MKSYINRFSLFAVILFLFACEKAENKINFKSGTNPVLTASTNAVNLQPGIESNTALKLSWTNPEYSFTTGISSHDVKYTLEIDTLGANFGSARKFVTVFSKDLSKTYTVTELNGIMGNDMRLPLDPRRTFTFQARLTSSLGVGTDAVPLPSNIITFTASPFIPPPKVEVPDLGTLWITGDAVASGWTNTPPAGQQFTRISNTLYQLTINMPSGGGYKLLQKQGDWDSQYHMTVGTWAGGQFEKKNSDPQFPGPPSAGSYKITVDFQLGEYTVVKQ